MVLAWASNTATLKNSVMEDLVGRVTYVPCGSASHGFLVESSCVAIGVQCMSYFDVGARLLAARHACSFGTTYCRVDAPAATLALHLRLKSQL